MSEHYKQFKENANAKMLAYREALEIERAAEESRKKDAEVARQAEIQANLAKLHAERTPAGPDYMERILDLSGAVCSAALNNNLKTNKLGNFVFGVKGWVIGSSRRTYEVQSYSGYETTLFKTKYEISGVVLARSGKLYRPQEVNVEPNYKNPDRTNEEWLLKTSRVNEITSSDEAMYHRTARMLENFVVVNQLELPD